MKNDSAKFIFFIQGYIFILQYNQKGLYFRKFVASLFAVRWNDVENFPLLSSLSSLITHIINLHIFLYNKKFSLRKNTKAFSFNFTFQQEMFHNIFLLLPSFFDILYWFNSRNTPLGIPHTRGKIIFNIAEGLLRSACHDSRMSIERTRAGWIIIGAIMTLGSSVVKGL